MIAAVKQKILAIKSNEIPFTRKLQTVYGDSQQNLVAEEAKPEVKIYGLINCWWRMPGNQLNPEIQWMRWVVVRFGVVLISVSIKLPTSMRSVNHEEPFSTIGSQH
ncbi:hypothetical protein NPIL_681641 [Nephila pilipes]|uniref:Uncharacterized protein n=1 Tax=Nephila pilipes TaxID=299642 RepID=A0A8X6MWG4_NEPPI|nr:hypothetical protein NPIL_681641 [Nephila pilipes]